jgi:hypothetical protein
VYRFEFNDDGAHMVADSSIVRRGDVGEGLYRGKLGWD